MHLIFVYGTLKRGFANYERVLATRSGVRFVAPARTVEAYPLFVDHYKVRRLLGARRGKTDSSALPEQRHRLVPS